jgi:2-polyprenyl-3-methyl-5-hydroxy-6-metoxy-1,4-benzoquinol methylase
MHRHKFIPKSRVEERTETAFEVARGKDVLHIGMGGRVDDAVATEDYIQMDLTETTHGRLARVAHGLTGVDINPTVIDAMRKSIPGDYLLADITDPKFSTMLNKKFDVVLFLEVIEHLDSFRSALDNIRKVLKPDGVLVLSTVNAFCIERFVKLIFRYESVHDEHTAYFSYRTLTRLLDMNGFSDTVDFAFTFQQRDSFAGFFDRAGYYTLRATANLFPQFAEGIVYVARPNQTTAVLGEYDRDRLA